MNRRSEHGRNSGLAVEWPTMMLILVCYALWLIGGRLFVVAPSLAIMTLALTVVLHSSLQHEAIHRHPTRRAAWNEMLVFLPIGLLVPYRRYRAMHLRHHADSRLTDPYDDPESYYLALYDLQRLPGWLRRLLAVNNTLAGRMLIGPAIGSIGFLLSEVKILRGRGADARACRGAWLRHGFGLIAVLSIVRFGFAMPVASYLVAAYLGLSLLALRSFCEHQWAENPDQRTVIVERSMLGLLYLNNNFHLVHHKQPGLPWYRLPGAYRARRDEWRAINRGYVFRGYGAVMRDYGLRAKEPVAHPARAAR